MKAHRPIACLLLSILAFLSESQADALKDLMPVPKEVSAQEGRFRLSNDFLVTLSGEVEDSMLAAATRFQRRLDEQTGLFFTQGFAKVADEKSETGLRVEIEREAKLELGEDESYSLSISSDSCVLKATTRLGAMHGLETLLQTLSADEGGYYFPALEIRDEPRFQWRGLMIDSSRHFMPLDVIKRNLDGMSAVKLNVMHWHLTDDQGFRVECKSLPQLHLKGSDGDFYTQDEVREIVQYAADRGIRVYPEFDVPGHATAWLVGMPELSSKEGVFEIERGWGIFEPTLDPSKEVVYETLETLFGEMAELFPDRYFHIGGDEVEGHHWDENASLAAFKAEHGISDNVELQAWFNKRILKILTNLDKKMVGWDEILHPEMPEDIVIHSWRGREAMVTAAKGGYSSILSNGYYIDLMQPASDHYLNDPLPSDIELSEEERSRVYGGEATMWSEHVTPETVDSRIWPRVAAIAERLWSEESVRSVEDMYRRLDIMAIRLEEHGLTHLKNREMMMRRLVRGYDYEALRVLSDVVEPLKIYQRNSDLSYRSFSPYTQLADIATADAKDARKFRLLVDQYSKNKDEGVLETITAQLRSWKKNHAAFAVLAERAPALRDALPLSENLALSAKHTLRVLAGKEPPNPSLFEAASASYAKVELQVLDAMQKLIEVSSVEGGSK